MEGDAELHHIRVLVVGETQVGKTLLIRRLCHQLFAPAASDNERLFLQSEWGPTVGFAVDVLMRDAWVQSGARMAYAAPSPAAPASLTYMQDSGGTTTTPAAAGSMQQKWQSPSEADNASLYGTAYTSVSSSNNRNSIGLHATTSALQRGASRPRAAPTRVTQTVEFHEVGGTRSFGNAYSVPLQLIDYDGVILVYERSNTTSTAYLRTWYRRIRRIFAAASSEEGRRRGMPRLMLIGTQLRPSTLRLLGWNVPARQGREDGGGGAASRKGEAAPFFASSSQLQPRGTLDEATLVNSGDAVRAMARSYNGNGDEDDDDDEHKRSGGAAMWGGHFCRRRRGIFAVWRRYAVLRSVAHFVMYALQGLGTALALMLHPSTLLSEMFAEEQGRRHYRLLLRVSEALATAMMTAERLLMFAMAVLLFGPRQQTVPVRQPTVRATLAEIRADPLCVTQVHHCCLYDVYAMEASLDEMLSFFDLLQREKLAHRGSTS